MRVNLTPNLISTPNCKICETFVRTTKVFNVIMPLNGEYKMPHFIKYFSTLRNQIAILISNVIFEVRP